jgi:hypothetical protein
MFLRNVSVHKIYTAPHPRRRHSSDLILASFAAFVWQQTSGKCNGQCTYRRFCSHPERNSLNIYRSEKCFRQKFQKELIHAINSQYAFSHKAYSFLYNWNKGSDKPTIVMLCVHFRTCIFNQAYLSNPKEHYRIFKRHFLPPELIGRKVDCRAYG